MCTEVDERKEYTKEELNKMMTEEELLEKLEDLQRFEELTRKMLDKARTRYAS